MIRETIHEAMKLVNKLVGYKIWHKDEVPQVAPIPTRDRVVEVVTLVFVVVSISLVVMYVAGMNRAVDGSGIGPQEATSTVR